MQILKEIPNFIVKISGADIILESVHDNWYSSQHHISSDLLAAMKMVLDHTLRGVEMHNRIHLIYLETIKLFNFTLPNVYFYTNGTSVVKFQLNEEELEYLILEIEGFYNGTNN